MGVLARQRLSDQRKRKQLLGNHTPMGQRAAKQNMQVKL